MFRSIMCPKMYFLNFFFTVPHQVGRVISSSEHLFCFVVFVIIIFFLLKSNNVNVKFDVSVTFMPWQIQSSRLNQMW